MQLVDSYVCMYMKKSVKIYCRIVLTIFLHIKLLVFYIYILYILTHIKRNKTWTAASLKLNRLPFHIHITYRMYRWQFALNIAERTYIYVCTLTHCKYVDKIIEHSSFTQLISNIYH